MVVVSMADAMQQVPLRIEDTDWEQFRALHGRAAAEAIRGFIAWQLHRPGVPEPLRPARDAVPGPPLLPDAVIEQFTAWYRRQPGAELPARPGGETSAKNVRLPAADWQQFKELHGGKASEAVKMFIAWQLHRPGAQLPLRIPAEDLQ
jgi:hypothetical protein